MNQSPVDRVELDNGTADFKGRRYKEVMRRKYYIFQSLNILAFKVREKSVSNAVRDRKHENTYGTM